MVSYSTAKAEALQVPPPRGAMRRQERAVLVKQRPANPKHGEGHVGKSRAEEIDERIKTLDTEIEALNAQLSQLNSPQ